MPELVEGDVIEVHGWVMLGKLDAGLYRIKKVAKLHGLDVYDIAKRKGKKTIVRHYANNVDTWLSTNANPDLNKIVKLTPTTKV